MKCCVKVWLKADLVQNYLDKKLRSIALHADLADWRNLGIPRRVGTLYIWHSSAPSEESRSPAGRKLSTTRTRHAVADIFGDIDQVSQDQSVAAWVVLQEAATEVGLNSTYSREKHSFDHGRGIACKMNEEENVRIMMEQMRLEVSGPIQRDLSPDHAVVAIPSEAASISSLPPEIIGLIFELAHNDGKNKLLVAVTLVSRHWRDIAIDTPTIWCHIDITPPWNFCAIQMCLDRSKSCLISLQMEARLIEGKNDSDDENEEAFDRRNHELVQNTVKLCELLSPHIPRCHSILIGGTFVGTTPMLVKILEGVSAYPLLPHLEHFTLRVDDADVAEDRSQRLSTLRTPLLRDIRLAGYGLTCRPSLTYATTLHLSAVNITFEYTEFRQLLVSAPSLETLVIYDDLIEGHPLPFILDDIEMSELRSIQIYGNMRSVSEVLLCISAPRLEDLVIAPVILNDIEKLHDHFPNKFTALKSLTFAPAHAHAFQTFPLASVCFPMIEHLTLANVYPSVFLSYFTRIDPILWPNLRSLAMREVNTTIGHDLQLVIDTRQRAGHPLSTLYLDSVSSSSSSPWFEGKLKLEVRDDWLIRRQSAFYQEDSTVFEGAPDD